MKKGDKVTIKDSSYSKVVTNNGLESGYGGIYNIRGEQGVIVEVDCSFPDPDEFQQKYRHFNNTIVKTNSSKVVFIEECFLELVLPTHNVMVDMIFHLGYCVGGEVVEISDELYQEIKRSS